MWLSLFVVIGVAAGLITIANSRMLPEMVSRNLLDTNVLRIIMPNTTFGALMMGRVLYFALFVVAIFLLSLNRWTVWLVFILAVYRGFVLVINIWWIIATFGMVMGLGLFLIYLVLFIVLLVLTETVMVYCIRENVWCRRGGLRGNLRWRDWQKPLLIFLSCIVVLAITEFIFYWLVLSRFVFVVPPFV